MTLQDIKKAIVAALELNLPAVKVYASEVKEGFLKPSFFIDVVLTRQVNRPYFKDVTVSCQITYFSKADTYLDKADISDRLFEIFSNYLAVGDRYLTIANPDSEMIDEGGSKYLLFSFELNYTDGKEALELKIEIPQDDGSIVENTVIMSPKPEAGYTQDTVKLMGELQFNETEG